MRSTSRYTQVPSQRDQLLLPGRQSLRIGGWSFSWSPAQLPVLCVSLRIGGWSFARSPAQLPVLVVSLRIGGRGFGRNSASATSSV